MKRYLVVLMIISILLSMSVFAETPFDNDATKINKNTANTSVAPYINKVIVVDTDRNGITDQKSIRISKDALLTEKGPTKLIGDARPTFKDQNNKPQVLLQGTSDLERLDTNHDKTLNSHDDTFKQLGLTYMLINGNMQTLPLDEVGVTAIHFNDPNKMVVDKADGSHEVVRVIEVQDLAGKH